MKFNCPWCGSECSTEVEPEEGQHILCPYCGKKFVYRRKRPESELFASGASVDGAGRPASFFSTIVGFVKGNKVLSITLVIVMSIAVGLCFDKEGTTVRLVSISNEILRLVGKFLALALFAFLLFVIVAISKLGWRVNKQAMIAIFDSLSEMGEKDFHSMTKAIIVLVFFILGLSSAGALFLLESIIVVVRANKIGVKEARVIE